MKFKRDTAVGEYFQQESNPFIFVNDTLNLFFINWNQTKNITFIINGNYKQELVFGNKDILFELLDEYLYKIDYEELRGNNYDIQYFYNSQQIQFNDFSNVGEFFLHGNNPIVTVNDINNIINFTKLNTVTFKATHGNIIKINIKPERTLKELLIKYYNEINHSELMISEQIQFLYNAKQIKYGDVTTVKNYFLNIKNPVILVMDLNNLLTNNEIKK